MKAVSNFIKFFSNTEFRLSRFSCVTCCKSVKPKFHITERPQQSEDKNVVNFVLHEHWTGLHDIQCARMHHLLLCCACSKRVYVVRRDVVHRIYQGVLYYLNMVRFYDTRCDCIYVHKKGVDILSLFLQTSQIPFRIVLRPLGLKFTQIEKQTSKLRIGSHREIDLQLEYTRSV